MSEGYRAVLAHVHDVGFGRFARESGGGILELLRECGVTEGRVVDLGCGSGIWAAQLLSAGYEVVGIDQSAPMLRIARRRAPAARFRRGSFVDAELPPCSAVTALGEVFNYLFDERNRGAALARVFRRVHAALRPGGIFLFDVAQPGRGRSFPAPRYFEGDGWAMGVRVEEKRGVLTRHISTFRSSGKSWTRDDEVHRLRLYEKADLQRDLRAAGFRVRALKRYGTFEFPPGYLALLGRRY